MELVTNLPMCNRFLLTPRHNEILAQVIHDVKWKAVSRKLRISVYETGNLDVFNWMEYMRKREKVAQEGPFVDWEEDALLLQMFDEKGEEIDSLKFKNISLVSHRCHFDMTATQHLTHVLTVQYQEVSSGKQVL